VLRDAEPHGGHRSVEGPPDYALRAPDLRAADRSGASAARRADRSSRYIVLRRLLAKRVPRGRRRERAARVPGPRHRTCRGRGMNGPALYRGTVWHARAAPRPHAFSYETYMIALDLDRLGEQRWMPIFGIERVAPLSF